MPKRSSTGTALSGLVKTAFLAGAIALEVSGQFYTSKNSIFGNIMASSKHTNHLDALNILVNMFDHSLKGVKQSIKESDSQGEYQIDFIRDEMTLMYVFSGFGDLMGYYIGAKQNRETICQSRIGIDGEALLYLPSFKKKGFQIYISENSEFSGQS